MFLIEKNISVDKPLRLRTITKYDNVLYNYNSRQLGLSEITTTCYYKLRQLCHYNSRQLFLHLRQILQFTTIVITSYDRTQTPFKSLTDDFPKIDIFIPSLHQWKAQTVTYYPGWGASKSWYQRHTQQPVDTHGSHVFINSVRCIIYFFKK